MRNLSLPRLSAFMRKEALQVVRDPSSILIALVLPMILMFLFGYAVSLDANTVRIGLVLEDTATEARDLAHAFMGTKYFDVEVSPDRASLEQKVIASHLRGLVVIPQDFSKNFLRGKTTSIQVIADGSETNTASFIQNYANGVVQNWAEGRLLDKAASQSTPITGIARFWFNPELKSRYMLLPGSLALIMALIGILLTALVVAREWERGTMEVLMSTPVSIAEIILGKIAPYFVLGLCSMALCVTASIFLFGVPFRGSLLILFLATSAFLLASLGQGLLISTLARNQFVAGQVSVMIGFLPAFILSGFLFEISSMPLPIRMVSYMLPPRYFVSIIQSSFLSGTSWSLFLPNMAGMLILAAIFLGLAAKKTVKRLD